MNNDTVKGKWLEVKGQILNAWGKLTNDDLDKTKGNIAEIAGLIRQHYGEAKEDVSKKLGDMFRDISSSVAEKSEEVKEDAVRKSDEIKQASRNDDEFQSPKMPDQPKNDPLISKGTFNA